MSHHTKIIPHDTSHALMIVKGHGARGTDHGMVTDYYSPLKEQGTKNRNDFVLVHNTNVFTALCSTVKAKV